MRYAAAGSAATTLRREDRRVQRGHETPLPQSINHPVGDDEAHDEHRDEGNDGGDNAVHVPTLDEHG